MALLISQTNKEIEGKELKKLVHFCFSHRFNKNNKTVKCSACISEKGTYLNQFAPSIFVYIYFVQKRHQNLKFHDK